MPIFCQDINEENAQRTANKVREGNGRAEAIGGDVSNEADVKAMFAACREAFGDCTLLFANAGYARLSPFVEMKTEDFDRMVAVLLRGVFLCDREGARPDAGEGRGRDHQHRLAARPQGSLPNGPLRGGEGRRHPGSPSRSRWKSRAAACASTPSAPAPCNTPILDDISDEWKEMRPAELPLGRFGEAWEIAETVAFLAGPGGAIYVGQTLGPNSGDVML